MKKAEKEQRNKICRNWKEGCKGRGGERERESVQVMEANLQKSGKRGMKGERIK